MYFDPTAFHQGDCKMRKPHTPEELSGASSFLRKIAAPRAAKTWLLRSCLWGHWKMNCVTVCTMAGIICWQLALHHYTNVYPVNYINFLVHQLRMCYLKQSLCQSMLCEQYIFSTVFTKHVLLFEINLDYFSFIQAFL